MLKFLLLLVIVVAAVAFLAARLNRKPPRPDGRRGNDDGIPFIPTGHVGLDTSRKPDTDTSPDHSRESATHDSGASDGGSDGGGGGGGD